MKIGYKKIYDVVLGLVILAFLITTTLNISFNLYDKKKMQELFEYQATNCEPMG